MQRPWSPHRILPVNAAKKSTPPVKAEAALSHFHHRGIRIEIEKCNNGYNKGIGKMSPAPYLCVLDAGRSLLHCFKPTHWLHSNNSRPDTLMHIDGQR